MHRLALSERDRGPKLEATAYRRRFLFVVMVSGAVCTTAFLVASLVGLNRLSPEHSVVNSLFTVLAYGLALLLLRRPRWFLPICVTYALAGFVVFLSALFYMPADELRVVWFFLHAAGTFVLLGTRVGWVFIAASLAVVVGAAGFGFVAYSPNALTTFSISLLTAGAFYHAGNRQIAAYGQAIRDSTDKLERLSLRDPLTDLLNNRALSDAWNRLTAPGGSFGRPLSLLFLDVDRFKGVNDTYGHAGGDVVLQKVATVLSAAARPADRVGRIGGEEFCLLLPDTDAITALAVAETIRAAIEASRPSIDGTVITVTASIGVATSRAPYGSLAGLQRAADDAMYTAKRGGRNRVVAAPATAGRLAAG